MENWKHVPLHGNVRQMASSCECFLAFTNMPRIVYWIPTLALALLACTIRTMERCICILQFALQWECDMFVVELKRRDRPPALGICQRKRNCFVNLPVRCRARKKWQNASTGWTNPILTCLGMSHDTNSAFSFNNVQRAFDLPPPCSLWTLDGEVEILYFLNYVFKTCFRPTFLVLTLGGRRVETSF